MNWWKIAAAWLTVAALVAAADRLERYWRRRARRPVVNPDEDAK